MDSTYSYSLTLRVEEFGLSTMSNLSEYFPALES